MQNIEAARKAAHESAQWNLQGLYADPKQERLETAYRETADCWMFFQRRDIAIPPERSLSQGAYAVSKHSMEERFVPDFRDNELRLAAYLELLSDHFLKAAQTNELMQKDAGANPST